MQVLPSVNGSAVSQAGHVPHDPLASKYSFRDALGIQLEAGVVVVVGVGVGVIVGVGVVVGVGAVDALHAA